MRLGETLLPNWSVKPLISRSRTGVAAIRDNALGSLSGTMATYLFSTAWPIDRLCNNDTNTHSLISSAPSPSGQYATLATPQAAPISNSQDLAILQTEKITTKTSVVQQPSDRAIWPNQRALRCVRVPLPALLDPLQRGCGNDCRPSLRLLPQFTDDAVSAAMV